MTEVRLKSVMQGGDADAGIVDLYDGSTSLAGFARATTLIARAFATGKAVSKAFSVRGVKLFREAPRHGSFVDGIRIMFDDDLVSAAQSQQFFQLVEWCFKEAVGVDVPDLEGPLLARVALSADQLVSYIQEPIRLMHRPIIMNNDIGLSIQRVQGSSLVSLDRYTAMRFEETISEEARPIIGSVTRFNSLSGWGRLRYEEEGRTISFLLMKGIPQNRRSAVTRSLHRYDRQEPARIRLRARVVTVGGDRIKRFLVDNVAPID